MMGKDGGLSSGLSFGGIGSSEKRAMLRGPALSGMCSRASVWLRVWGRFRKLPGDQWSYFPRTRREISPVPGCPTGQIVTFAMAEREQDMSRPTGSGSAYQPAATATAAPNAMAPWLDCHARASDQNIICLHSSVPGADR